MSGDDGEAGRRWGQRTGRGEGALVEGVRVGEEEAELGEVDLELGEEVGDLGAVERVGPLSPRLVELVVEVGGVGGHDGVEVEVSEFGARGGGDAEGRALVGGRGRGVRGGGRAGPLGLELLVWGLRGCQGGCVSRTVLLDAGVVEAGEGARDEGTLTTPPLSTSSTSSARISLASLLDT